MDILSLAVSKKYTEDTAIGMGAVKGKDGEPGPQGPQGPQGEIGPKGKDGSSITITKITESSEDGGENIVVFSDGKKLSVKNGKGGGGGLTEVGWEDIKNKPFDATTGFVPVIENQTATTMNFEDEIGVPAQGFSFKAKGTPMTDAEWYNEIQVSFDGVIYNVTKKYFQGMEVYYFGNGSILNLMGINLEDTGEPFVMALVSSGNHVVNYVFITADIQETKHTIAMSVLDEIIKPLDIKYLPKNMALGYEEKPFDDITWNGIATDKEIVTILEMESPEDESTDLVGYYLIKTSDAPIVNINDVIGGYVTIDEGSEYLEEITSDAIVSGNDYWYYGKGISLIVNVTSAPVLIDFTNTLGVTVEISSIGVYFFAGYFNRDFTAPVMHTVALKPNSKITTIDPKFIPADLDFNLDDYYTKNQTYSKSEVNQIILEEKVDLNNYYTKEEVYGKSEVDDALNNIDLSNYYTKTEIDNIIGDINTVLDEISALIGE